MNFALIFFLQICTCKISKNYLVIYCTNSKYYMKYCVKNNFAHAQLHTGGLTHKPF